MPHKLKVFISSTGDLKAERDAVESVLAEMDIDDERFESWPSTPNHPITECLQRVEESDAFILLLGKRYGTPSPSKSGTHLEFDHVQTITPKRVVFAYLLGTSTREEKQDEFVNIVRKKVSLGHPISNIQELKQQIKCSLLTEFVRCYYLVHLPPAGISSLRSSAINQAGSPINLADDPAQALKQILALYDNRNDFGIHQITNECESRFGNNPEIMNLIFMAQVNLAMDGVDVSRDSLLKAIKFWDSKEARNRWAGEGLYYNQGNAFTALGLQREAINRFREALALRSDSAQCWKNLGNAYLQDGNIAAATECFETALRIQPTLFEALHSMAILAMRDKQDFESALVYLNRIWPSNLRAQYQARVYYLKACVFLKLYRYPEGIAEAENAITNSPESEWSWQVAARLYALVRRGDKTWLKPALNFWQRFLKRFPNSSWAWAETGFIYWSLRNGVDKFSQLALDAFEKSVELGLDDSGLVADRIGHLYQEQGSWVKAEKAYREAYLKDAAQFGYCLGVSLMHFERYAEALPLMLAAAEKHQPDALSWRNLAVCYEKTAKDQIGNNDKAEAAYNKAIELDQNYAEAWFDMGGFYWNQGDAVNAVSTWEKAVKRFPQHPDCERVRVLLAAPYRKK